MAAVPTNYNANDIDPRGNREPIPAGDYLAEIVESCSKPTKANDGSSYLELKFAILDGPHKGRNLWARLNTQNKNQQAVSIALAELSAICHCVNVMQPRDTIELHKLPLILVVKLKKKRDESGEMENVISGYKTKDGKTPGRAGSTNTPGPSQQSSPGAAPWKRG